MVPLSPFVGIIHQQSIANLKHFPLLVFFTNKPNHPKYLTIKNYSKILLNIISILLTLGNAPDCDGYGMCILEQQMEVNEENCLKYDHCLRAEMSYENIFTGGLKAL